MNSMLKRLGALMAGAVFLASPAKAEIVLDVLYTTPNIFSELHKELAEEFTKAHPDIKIKFRNPATNYEDGAQKILRDQIINSLPDVAFNGINQIGLFVDKGIGANLDDFAKADGGLVKLGYYPALAALGEWKGHTYGLPFAVSTPVMFVNEDLVELTGTKADALPTTWPELVKLGKDIEAKAGKDTIGFYYEWDQTGNWLIQSLVTSHGGRILKDDKCTLAFDDENGMWALKTLETFGKAGMPNLAKQGRQAFIAGKVGIDVGSTAGVGAAERGIGDRFRFKTVAFPVPSSEGRLPAGGNVAMILAKDAERQKAAWEYIKFVTGPVGQTKMVNLTGYMPSNELAVTNPELLGNFYKENPNHRTSIGQLPKLTEWTSFPGENSLKIIDVIKTHAEALATGRATAEETMPALIKDVQKLLPDCSK